MLIDKISGINPASIISSTQKSAQTNAAPSNEDTIEVSQEARDKATEYYMNQVAAETPDVRADRVAEVKKAISDPGYMSDARIAATAEKIMSALYE